MSRKGDYENITKIPGKAQYIGFEFLDFALKIKF